MERALAEPPPRAHRGGLAVELALADAAVGTADAVARVRDALTLVGDPRQRARVLGALARLLFARSELAGAAEAADLAMAETDPADPLANRLLAHRLVIGAFGLDAGTVANVTFGELMAAGEPPTEPALLALLAHAAVAAGGPASRARELAQRALAGLGDDDGFYGVISGTAVLALLRIDELDLAAPTRPADANGQHALLPAPTRSPPPSGASPNSPPGASPRRRSPGSSTSAQRPSTGTWGTSTRNSASAPAANSPPRSARPRPDKHAHRAAIGVPERADPLTVAQVVDYHGRALPGQQQRDGPGDSPSGASHDRARGRWPGET